MVDSDVRTRWARGGGDGDGDGGGDGDGVVTDGGGDGDGDRAGDGDGTDAGGDGDGGSTGGDGEGDRGSTDGDGDGVGSCGDVTGEQEHKKGGEVPAQAADVLGCLHSCPLASRAPAYRAQPRAGRPPAHPCTHSPPGSVRTWRCTTCWRSPWRGCSCSATRTARTRT